MALAIPLILGMLASVLVGTEGEGMMGAMCFYLFVGCCSGAMASFFIPTKQPSPDSNEKTDLQVERDNH